MLNRSMMDQLILISPKNLMDTFIFSMNFHVFYILILPRFNPIYAIL